MDRLTLTVTFDFDEAIEAVQAEAIRANVARAIHQARMNGVVTPDDMDALIDEVVVEIA